MLAELRGVGASGIADLEAERVGAHEATRAQVTILFLHYRWRTHLCHSITCWKVLLFPLLLANPFVYTRPPRGLPRCTHGENQRCGLELLRSTHKIGTVGVELSSTVVGLEVDLGLVNETNDLEVAGGLHELNTGDGTSGDDTGTTALLGAPGDLLTLGVTNGGAGLGGSPNTPVVEVVDEGSLAEGVDALGGGVAKVVTLLGPTDTIVGIRLVGLWSKRK